MSALTVINALNYSGLRMLTQRFPAAGKRTEEKCCIRTEVCSWELSISSSDTILTLGNLLPTRKGKILPHVLCKRHNSDCSAFIKPSEMFTDTKSHVDSILPNQITGAQDTSVCLTCSTKERVHLT